MSTMRVSVTGNVSAVFLEMSKKWPSLMYGVLSMIGYEGRRALYEGFLQGRIIRITDEKYPFDIKGRRTVSYGINRRRQSVKISSYPLNLYNPRAVYSQARPEVESRINSEINSYEAQVLQRRIAAMDRLARAVPSSSIR